MFFINEEAKSLATIPKRRAFVVITRKKEKVFGLFSAGTQRTMFLMALKMALKVALKASRKTAMGPIENS